jgi:glutamine amidotransferase
MITIVDYGMGNLGSVLNMFKKVGVEAEISSNPNNIKNAKKILLPGVGAFDAAMSRINSIEGLLETLNHKALIEKVPVLGICLGMQLLTKGSEEGVLPGLGWIEGSTYHFKGKIDDNLRIPHMGWNTVNICKKIPITNGFSGEVRFYFVHSYFVKVENEVHSLMKTKHGVEFDSAVIKDNIIGAQFHPEKSHKFGMQLFKNFATL